MFLLKYFPLQNFELNVNEDFIMANLFFRQTSTGTRVIVLWNLKRLVLTNVFISYSNVEEHIFVLANSKSNHD